MLRVALRCLAIAIAAIGASRPALAVSWETLLDDDCSTIDPGRWTVESNGGGGAAPGDGLWEIRSGPQEGGGTWLQSVQTFDVSACDYAVTIVCRPQSPVVGHNDSASWGFLFPYPPSVAYSQLGFFVTTKHILDGPSWYAETNDRTSESNGTVGTLHRRLLGETGWEPMTEYRTEVIQGTAKYYVDGELVFSQSCPDVPLHPYHVRIDKTSPGENRYLYVDHVKVERSTRCVAARETVLFSSSRGNGDGSFDIWATKKDGTFPRRLTNTPDVDERWPRLSPDGRTILATQQDFSLGQRGNGRLFRFQSDGSVYKEILTNIAHKSPLAAAWSGDGTRVIVAVHAGPDDEFHQLWSYELTAKGDGINGIALTTGGEANAGQAESPHVSPDGTLVAFNGGAIGARLRVFVVDAFGNRQISLDVSSGDPWINLQNPRWSPDGDRIVCMAEVPGGAHQLRMIDYSSQSQDLFHEGYGVEYPIFVASERVLFDSREGANWDLWLVDADGTDAGLLTSDAAEDRMPEYGVMLSDLEPTPGSGGAALAARAARAASESVSWLSMRPNPTSGSVELSVRAPDTGPWNVSIYNVAGVRVRSLSLGVPEGTLMWDGRDERGGRVASGVYFVRLAAGGHTQVDRITVLR